MPSLQCPVLGRACIPATLRKGERTCDALYEAVLEELNRAQGTHRVVLDKDPTRQARISGIASHCGLPVQQRSPPTLQHHVGPTLLAAVATARRR